MNISEDVLLSKIKNTIKLGDPEEALKLAKEYTASGYDPLKAINTALIPAIQELGEAWIKEEATLLDLIVAAEAFKAALDILKEELRKRGSDVKFAGRAIIGTVEGDVHSLGKTLVATIWETIGLEVIDLGVDVPAERFVEAIKQYNPGIVGLSALMTTTMLKQKEVIEAIKAAGLRNRVKIIIGGAPTTEEWAMQIGADGWAPDALSSISIVKAWLEQLEQKR